MSHTLADFRRCLRFAVLLFLTLIVVVVSAPAKAQDIGPGPYTYTVTTHQTGEYMTVEWKGSWSGTIQGAVRHWEGNMGNYPKALLRCQREWLVADGFVRYSCLLTRPAR